MEYSIGILIAVFFVSGCVGIFLAMRQHPKANEHISTQSWTQSPWFYFSMAMYLLAIFFFLISLHDLLPVSSSGLRIFVYILAGIVLIGDGISAVLMIRYFLIWAVQEIDREKKKREV
jgi:hypothetical protein